VQSSSFLGGTLARRPTGWHWTRSGEHEPLVFDARLGDLLPRFYRLEFQHARALVAIACDWRSLSLWSGDLHAGEALDALVERAPRVQLATGPHWLVPLAAWNELVDRAIPAWFDHDAVYILLRARREASWSTDF
jgi:hypothetical protein